MARTKEDAVLYAAAPELLEALEAVIYHAGFAALQSDGAKRAIDSARAAIAKAKEG